MNSIADKVALVTGASQGLGQAIAIEPAKQGMHTLTRAFAENEDKTLLATG